MARRFSLIGLVLALLTLCACGASRENAYNAKPSAAVATASAAAEVDIEARAKEAWSRREDGAQLRTALGLYKKIAMAQPSRRDVLTLLSRGYYLLAIGHLEGEDQVLKALDTGAKWGERILGLRAEFIKCIADGAKDHECLQHTKKEDVPGIYWAYANLGRWSVLKGFTTVLANKSKLKNFVDAAARLDPDYYYGAADRGLGAFYAKAPSFAGGYLDKSDAHFKKSLKVAPNYLGTRVLMAEYWAVKKQDKALFKKLLGEVIAADTAVEPDIVPIQKIEQRKAKKLLEQADDLFE